MRRLTCLFRLPFKFGDEPFRFVLLLDNDVANTEIRENYRLGSQQILAVEEVSQDGFIMSDCVKVP